MQSNTNPVYVLMTFVILMMAFPWMVAASFSPKRNVNVNTPRVPANERVSNRDADTGFKKLVSF